MLLINSHGSKLAGGSSLEQQLVMRVIERKVEWPSVTRVRIVHLQAFDAVERGQVVGQADFVHDHAILGKEFNSISIQKRNSILVTYVKE